MLLQFESREARPLPAARGDCSRQTTYCEKAKIEGSPNVVVINVSPIEYGHGAAQLRLTASFPAAFTPSARKSTDPSSRRSRNPRRPLPLRAVLLVPRVMDSLPQMLTPELLLTALHFTAEAANPYFRVGYNSLGAYATINHCHFQAYFLTAHFPIERAPASPLASAAGCRHHASLGGASVQRLAHFPVRSLVYELGSSLEELARAVGAACVALQQMDVAFNVLIVDRGARVFLMPNKFATRVANGVRRPPPGSLSPAASSSPPHPPCASALAPRRLSGSRLTTPPLRRFPFPAHNRRSRTTCSRQASTRPCSRSPATSSTSARRTTRRPRRTLPGASSSRRRSPRGSLMTWSRSSCRGRGSGAPSGARPKEFGGREEGGPFSPSVEGRRAEAGAVAAPPSAFLTFIL